MDQELLPGLNLDQIIAEKVMGWKRGMEYRQSLLNTATVIREPNELHAYLENPCTDSGPRRHYICGCKAGVLPEGAFGAVELPAFSTQIAAAWTVVDRMLEVHHADFFLNSESALYTAIFSQVSGNIRPFGEIGESLPNPAHAICLAALRQLGLLKDGKLFKINTVE